MRAGAPGPDHSFRFWNVDPLPREAFDKHFAEAATLYPQSRLGHGSWQLEGTSLQALRDKIMAGRPGLGTVFGVPYRGIVTGLNDAFVIDTETKNQLCTADPGSAKLLKPFLEGKDLKRWRSEPRGLWIIYIPKNRFVIDDYPAIRDWLLPFKERLEARATVQKWYELQQAQESYAPALGLPKIAYPHFSSERLFSFEKTGAFSNDKTYFIGGADGYLLALLNSAPLWFILSNLAPAVRGGYHELRVQYVETLPIPAATEAEKSALGELSLRAQTAAEQRLALQRQVTRRLGDLRPQGSVAQLSERLKSWWELPDFASFQAEIRKVFKGDIPLKDRSDWEGCHECPPFKAHVRGHSNI